MLHPQYSSPTAQYGSPTAQYSSPTAQYGSPTAQYSSPTVGYPSPSSPHLGPDTAGPRGLQAPSPSLAPRGPAELFGLGEARSPTLGQPLPPMSPLDPPAPWTPQPPTSPKGAGANPTGPPGPQSQPWTQGLPSPQPSGSWAAKVDFALSSPTVVGRIAELTPLLPQVPTKELHAIFQTILEKVFGLQSGGRGWEVATTQRSLHPREYTALSSFLSTSGPVLTAAHRLLGEPYLRHEFPVSRLPAGARREVEGGLSSHPLLQGRSSPGRGTISVNSFEYYLLTWAAYIVQPYTQDNRLVAGESVYPYILEDYLQYFLPCDGSTPPRLPFQLPHSLPPSPRQDTSPTPSTPARKSLLRHPASLSSPSTTSTPRVNHALHQLPAQDQTWRSETLLHIFSLVWLTQFDASQDSPPIPVQDTLKIVRMLIKHLHYFANSGGPADVTPLDRLKRAVLPMARPKLYTMFKFIFSHWPHDSSFRLVLETWLSFIQPWRYTDRARPQGEQEGTVDSRWQTFVAENLLLYSVVLRLLVPRLLRMDLTSMKNSYLLFRAAKVLSQSGLPALLQAAEAGLERREARSPLLPSLLTGPEVEEGVAAAARQAMLELEGAGHRYEAAFGTEFRQAVVELLCVAERAREAARAGLQELEGAGEGEGGGWLAWLAGGGPEQGRGGGVEAEELRRTVQHLSCSTAALADVFSVASPGEEAAGAARGRLVSAGGAERVETEAGLVLTPHGRWQLVQGIARGEARYEGDPDLRPIHHGEVVTLVRLLHQAGLWAGGRWRLGALWHRGGVLGLAARQVLAPPCTFVVVEKRVSGGPPSRTLSSHPARLNLRPLASKKFLLYLATYLAFFRLLGYSPLSSLLLLLLLSSLLLLLLTLGRLVRGEGRTTSLLDTSDLGDEKKTN